MFDPDRARRLAQVALEESPADETEVSVSQYEQELNRFTADHPVQNLVRRMAGVAVRVRVDGREGKASTGTPTDEAVRRTVRRAIEVARHMPAARELLPLPGPQEGYRLRRPDPLTPDPAHTAESVARMTSTCREKGCTAAGVQGVENDLRLVANSNGLEVWDLDTSANVSLSVFHTDGAGWADAVAARRDGIDVDGVAGRAVGKALASAGAHAIPPGDYTVVLEPSAVSALLLFAAYKGFGAQQVQDGSSFLAGHMGERVANETVSIADDVYHPLTVGHVFDGEGVPRTPVSLIDHGVARGVVHDRRTAKRTGCRTTGHATPQPSAMGPLPSNLVLAAGDGSTEDLIRDVDRGILVTEFHYTNMVEPTRLTLTGMTRNGTFLIENGVVTRPIRNMRFTQSLVEALGRVSGIGGDARLAGALFGGHIVVPSVRVDGFRFTSQTEF